MFRQRRACDLRPRTSSKQSFWWPPADPEHRASCAEPQPRLLAAQAADLACRADPKVVERGRRRQLIESILERVCIENSPKPRFLRAILNELPVGHYWLLRLGSCFAPPLQHCRKALKTCARPAGHYTCAPNPSTYFSPVRPGPEEIEIWTVESSKRRS